ncbi:hypothetical protein Pcinc_032471 [Petrolisthes cinctipes]|uniref:PiggyBac transposable element-derived protein domain-containing protein n=1 Tax=Petrolisthes cinctipes TaxID=88211 RepID=A0AAE1EUC0_PETCI|nr:hypothetical protein Pcinc_032471 [Petrolisthes cinctipes]
MKIGESVAAFNYEDKVTLQCTKVSNTKMKQLLSTIHHNPKKIEKEKTDIQMFYNATKGGVDSFDQRCCALSCSRKTRRWPLCLFYGIINLAMVNSYIIYQSKERTPMTRRDYHRHVAEKLSYLWAVSRLQGQMRLSHDLRDIRPYGGPSYPCTRCIQDREATTVLHLSEIKQCEDKTHVWQMQEICVCTASPLHLHGVHGLEHVQ